MKAIKIILIVCILGIGTAWGQKSSVVGKIVLRIKSYEHGSRENETGIAMGASLQIRNVLTADTVVLKSKYGMFKMNLAIGQLYVVKVSKPGYVSKSIIISTAGADTRYKYLLRFDFYLQRYGVAEYSNLQPVVCIVHNRHHYRFDLTDCGEKVLINQVNSM